MRVEIKAGRVRRAQSKVRPLDSPITNQQTPLPAARSSDLQIHRSVARLTRGGELTARLNQFIQPVVRSAYPLTPCGRSFRMKSLSMGYLAIRSNVSWSKSGHGK